ncbi:MAG: hypothetical protein XD93_1191 [candidate division WS6 bacterium 34_10]|uniref:Uncharacterized protein n=1 Tax=candidate division WS6 bacterium 34_10 TaxID=1641389 RepID=A0A101HG20_9BACT|nr:MAG: hypothetical protein XD93_1191 [candidate division WS6 bacterium 34_10]
MNMPNLSECLEPETVKRESVIYKKAVLINSQRHQIFTTESLKKLFLRDSTIVLPSIVPDETAIRLSIDNIGDDCLEVIMNGESRELSSKSISIEGEDSSINNKYPVEALYMEINGFGIKAEFNRENPLDDIKAVLEISECVDSDMLSPSVV